jgi:hypothetical protein
MTFGLSRRTKTCFADGCERLIPVTQLMCREHWALVPQDLKQEVLHTLVGWQGGETPRPYLDAIKRARVAVKAIEERAAASIEGRVGARLKPPTTKIDVLGVVGDGGRVTFRSQQKAGR